MQQEPFQEPLNEEQSLKLISDIISKTRSSHHETGVLSILWGTVITLCALGSWAKVSNWFTLPFDVWLLTIVAVIPTVYYSVQSAKKKGVKHFEDDALDYIWICFGIGIFLITYANNFVFSFLQQAQTATNTSTNLSSGFAEVTSTYFLTIYGIPTMVTGLAKKFKPMIFGGVVCWISALIVPFTPYPVDLLLMAASAFLAWFVPGVMLYRMYRKQQMAHV